MQYGSEYQVPVMPDEVLSLLVSNRDGIFVDGTSGGGGHSEAILNTLNPPVPSMAANSAIHIIFANGENSTIPMPGKIPYRSLIFLLT